MQCSSLILKKTRITDLIFTDWKYFSILIWKYIHFSLSSLGFWFLCLW